MCQVKSISRFSHIVKYKQDINLSSRMLLLLYACGGMPAGEAMSLHAYQWAIYMHVLRTKIFFLNLTLY